MRRLFVRARWFLAAAIVAAGLAGGVAVSVAYWTGNGEGSTDTVLKFTELLTISAGTPSEQLFPGGNASVAITTGNPNAYNVHIGSLFSDTSAGTGGFSVDAEHSGCDLSTLAFVPQDNDGAGWTVPPRAGGTDGTLGMDVDDALTMTANASNACQGATFTVHLRAAE